MRSFSHQDAACDQDNFKTIFKTSASPAPPLFLTNDFLLCQHSQIVKFTTSLIIVENLMMINNFNIWLVCILLNIRGVIEKFVSFSDTENSTDFNYIL